VWVATVNNIDWPAKPGLPSEEQRAQLRAIFDRCADLRLNAVILQMRPATDALYPSRLEPWSEYLTGRQGDPPNPPYDPLKFAVEEAHARGLELHVWFNPYRSKHPTAKGPLAENHISRTNPKIVKTYGQYLWMDPGEPATQKHSLNVILDAVKRYDIDGVHIDDYFYPYKEKDAKGEFIDFPDEPAWQAYLKSGGKLARDDWRRSNVDRFIERLYKEIKQTKRWVKFGISPFGIWRPGNPPQIQGYDQYANLYADARKWIMEGWCDYYAPQLYWRIDPPAQSYPVLLKWWCQQNPLGRHIWPGNYTGRLSEGAAGWTPTEIVNQIRKTREQEGATGNIHFSMKTFMQNRMGINDTLKQNCYTEQALVPASPWLGGQPPAKPAVRVLTGPGGMRTVALQPGKERQPWWWAVQARTNGQWKTAVYPGTAKTAPIPADADAVCVRAVDRVGTESEAALIIL
jgi:uncharacterized lipoprotein YddW (UPF0748 family)